MASSSLGPSASRSAAHLWLLLIAVLVGQFFVGLGSVETGSGPDEASYLAVSSDMAARGEWLAPTIDGHPVWFKPPLMFWLIRLSLSLFGQTIFGARFPVALAAVFLALTAGAMASRIGGGKSALEAAALTGTCAGLVRFGRLAMFDVPFALSVCVALYALLRATEEPRRRSWLVAAGVATGIAVMTKGPGGIILIGAIGIPFLLWRSPKVLWSPSAALAALAAFVIGGAWHVYAFAKYGRAFVDVYLLREHAGKFGVPWTWTKEGELLLGFLVMAIPWVFLGVSAMLGVTSKRHPGRVLALLGILVPTVLFTIPGFKHAHYLLPAIPLLFVLVATTTRRRWTQLVTAAMLGLVAVGILLSARIAPIVGSLSLVIASVALAWSAACVLTNRLFQSALLVGIAVMLALGVAWPTIAPPYVPSSLGEITKGRDTWIYGRSAGVFSIALGRQVVRAYALGDFQAAIGAGAPVIMTKESYDSLPESFRGNLGTLLRWPIIGHPRFSEIASAIVAREPSPMFQEMVLVETAH